MALDGMRRASLPREPMFNVPVVVLALAAAFLAVQSWRSLVVEGDGERVLAFLGAFAFVPLRFTIHLFGVENDALQESVANFGADELALASVFVPEALAWGLAPWTLVTHAFVHGNWTHVGTNVLWLLAFGTPVARRIGPFRMVLFFLVVAALGAAGMTLLGPLQPWPLVGASGAISGLMGAAMRFMFSGPAGLGRLSHDGRRMPIAEALVSRQVLVFGGAFVALNLVFATGLVPPGIGEGRVAWEVHLAGFAAGFLLFALFDREPAKHLAAETD